MDARVNVKGLRYGGRLDPEQEFLYVRQLHPWFADVGAGWTYHSKTSWWRADAVLGRRLAKRWSASLGGLFEQRYAGAEL